MVADMTRRTTIRLDWVFQQAEVDLAVIPGGAGFLRVAVEFMPLDDTPAPPPDDRAVAQALRDVAAALDPPPAATSGS